MNKIGIILIIISAGFVLTSRIFWLTESIDFGSDQARDLNTVIDYISSGNLPQYGPITSRGFNIFPHYYYFLYLSVMFFGNSPLVHILINSIFNVISLILLIFLCGQIFYKSKYKLFILGIISTIYSFNRDLIWQANTMWNPNFLPLFLLILITLLFKMIDISSNNIKVIKPSFIKYSLFCGAISSIMMGLHGSSFIILPIFTILIGVLFEKKLKNIFYIYNFIGWFILSISYFFVEINNNFSNTIRFSYLILTNGKNYIDFNLFQRFVFLFHNAFYSWVDIITEVYLPKTLSTYIIFISILSFSGLIISSKNNKKNKVLLILALVYILSSANLTGLSHLHFMYFAYLLPPIGVILLLERLQYQKVYSKVILVFSIFIYILSTQANYKDIDKYYNQKFNDTYRSISFQDTTDILNFAKQNNISKICLFVLNKDIHSDSFEYIKKNILNLNLIIEINCLPKNNELLVIFKGNGSIEYPEDLIYLTLRM